MVKIKPVSAIEKCRDIIDDTAKNMTKEIFSQYPNLSAGEKRQIKSDIKNIVIAETFGWQKK